MGALENSHKKLNEYIRIYTQRKSWWKTIPYFEFVCNNAEHSATSYSPFEGLYILHSRGHGVGFFLTFLFVYIL